MKKVARLYIPGRDGDYATLIYVDFASGFVERKKGILIQEPPMSAEAMYRALRIVKNVDVEAPVNRDSRADERFVSILQKMI